MWAAETGSEKRCHSLTINQSTISISWCLIELYCLCVSCNLFTARELNNLNATGNSTAVQLVVKPVIVVGALRSMHYEVGTRMRFCCLFTQQCFQTEMLSMPQY